MCLYGDLGMGKTTFTQGFAVGLGITARLTSPTFVLMRSYPVPESDRILYHLDLYRLDDIHMVESLGLSDIFNDPSSVVLVEWAERLGGHIPPVRTDIRFLPVENDARRIIIRENP